MKIIQLQLELPLDYAVSVEYARRAWRQLRRAMIDSAEARRQATIQSLDDWMHRLERAKQEREAAEIGAGFICGLPNDGFDQ